MGQLLKSNNPMLQRSIEFLSSSSSSFLQKIAHDYLNCSLIGKNIIDFEVYRPKEFQTLKASYSYDCLMIDVKNAFESCQKLFGFLKDNAEKVVRIVPEGLGLQFNQSGMKVKLMLNLSSFNMTEKKIKDVMGRLLEENQNLKTQIQKQAQDYNFLMEEMLKENEKLSHPQKYPCDQEKQEENLLLLKQKQWGKIAKTKIIKKDRQEPKEYQKYHYQSLPYQVSIEPKVTKECELCRKIYEGKEYFKYCPPCFERNKGFLRRY